jgi:hypothetical protein
MAWAANDAFLARRVTLSATDTVSLHQFAGRSPPIAVPSGGLKSSRKISVYLFNRYSPTAHPKHHHQGRRRRSHTSGEGIVLAETGGKDLPNLAKTLPVKQPQSAAILPFVKCKYFAFRLLDTQPYNWVRPRPLGHGFSTEERILRPRGSTNRKQS